MSPARFFRKLNRATGRAASDRELRAEMHQHLEMKIEDNLAAGMPPAEARQAALREFGNPLLLREESADAWSLPFESLWLDVRYAARALRKSPGYTAVALLTLALGIGANAAIFSIVYGVLLQPLPYPEASRLVRIDETGKGSEFAGFALSGVSPVDYYSFRERNHAFDAVGAYADGSVLVKIGDVPERVHSLQSTSSLFAVLGRQPVLGRIFGEQEELQANSHVAIVSARLWQKAFASDEHALGRTLNVNGEPYTVIGVMPRDFDFPVDNETDVWTPLEVPHDPKLQGARYMQMVGRMKPGISAAQAQADLQVIAAGQKPFQWLVVATGLSDSVVSKVRPSLWMLLGAVGFVLLIAAANMASLALSRVAARQKDAAVRLALGASRWRLARSLFAESLLLAIMAAAAGLLLARLAMASLLGLAPSSLPRLDQVHINAPVLLFAFAAAALAGLLLGAAPAWRAGRTDLHQAIKEGGPTLAGARQPLQTAIVSFEMVLAVMLLVGAGLMIRTMVKLHAVNLGFDPHQVLTAEVVLPDANYKDPAKQRAFLARLMEGMKALPGVQSAASTSNLPMSGSSMVFRLVFSEKGQPEKSIVGGFRSVTPDYFQTLRVPLARGRYFTEADNDASTPVAIINEALARKMWPDADPIGKKMPTGFTKEVTIIGVVPDMHFDGFDSAPRPELFAPYTQKAWPFMRLVLRTSGDPLALAPALRNLVRSIDSGQTVDKVRTLDEVLSNSTADRRFYMLLLSAFAALALGLAAIGVFGVVSYAVTQRTHEIGVRMAFGASASQIAAMVLRKGLLPAVFGLVGGLAGALALTRVLRTLLFGVSGNDPLTFAAVALVLLAAAAMACYLPARRATRVSPMAALRYE